MDAVYWVSLLVGGFFVLLSLFGGGDTDSDTDLAAGHDADLSADAHVDLDVGHDVAAGPGFVDLLSIRTLFLFAAFFGLTGLVLSWFGGGEPFTAIVSVLTGLVVGFGGNYFIKRVGYETVSSDVSVQELKGTTAKVLVPFEGGRKGKISLVARGNRLQLVARSLDEDSPEAFRPGDEVVVVRMSGSVAEVVKPT